MSAVDLKFRIQSKWFNNIFFVTRNSWNSNYQLILGYDFIQRNKILLDSANKKLIVGNSHLDFNEISPISKSTNFEDSENDSGDIVVNACENNECNSSKNNVNIENSVLENDCNYSVYEECTDSICSDNSVYSYNSNNVSNECDSNNKCNDNKDNEFNNCSSGNCTRNKKKNQIKVVNNVTIQPNSFEIVKLKIPCSNNNVKQILVVPKKQKSDLTTVESLHEIFEEKFVCTLVENTTDKPITLRKKSCFGTFHPVDNFEVTEPTKQQSLQVNNLTLTEVRELRKAEIKATDFDLNHLNPSDKKGMQEMLLNNYDVFSKSYKTLGKNSDVVPSFNLLHEFPIQTKPYQIPKIAKQFAKQEIAALLEAKIIEPSTSSYCFPVIFVKKKSLPTDDPAKLKWRMAVDYRILNSITESYKICLPKISEILHNIAGRELYCVLDLKSAFFQIVIKESDREKLAFCSELGNFQPCRLPFGSLNSTSYFHTLISMCLKDLIGLNVQFFLDDIIVAANSIEEMKLTLQQVFDRLRKFNLTLDPGKLQVCRTKISYLGFMLDRNGFYPSDDNVKKISNFPVPRNFKEVQSFVGMVNFFRHLVYNFAEIISPIVNLTKKSNPFVWSDKCQQAFDRIQDIILKRPTLKPISDSDELFLACDASKIAICGILLKKCNDKFEPVEFFSRQLNPAQSRYPSIRRELYAIFASVKFFHQYLFGKSFTILTDAKPLTFHIQLDKQPEVVARWLLYLQSFDYRIEHIPGLSNPADFLSRVTEENLVVNNINLFVVDNVLTSETIVQHQNSDKNICKILDKLKNNDNETKKKYFIDSYSKMLMIKLNPRNRKFKSKHVENKIVLPSALVRNCIMNAHAPHFGSEKTYLLIRQKYFWKGMFLDIKNFCENCSKCLENKPKPSTRTTMQHKHNLAPGEEVSIDIVGKLPRSVDNKFYILTIIDHYSRFFEAFPLTSTTSSAIINCLNKYFASYGIPKYLRSDNGSYFVSEEFESFLKNLNITHKKSSIYYPKSQGLIERIHRQMKESIASLCSKSFEWSEKLLFFKLHYNNSEHSVTKFSPAKLFLGRELNIPLKMHQDPKFVEDYREYSQNLEKQIQNIREQVEENESNYFAIHEKHVRGRKVPALEIGDRVFKTVFQDHTTFKKRYTGPHEVIRVLRNDNYLIQMNEEENNKIVKLHVSKLFQQKNPRQNLKE